MTNLRRYLQVDLERGREMNTARKIQASKQVGIIIGALLGLFLVILVGGFIFLSYQQ